MRIRDSGGTWPFEAGIAGWLNWQAARDQRNILAGKSLLWLLLGESDEALPLWGLYRAMGAHKSGQSEPQIRSDLHGSTT
jgi:hypothetical protein